MKGILLCSWWLYWGRDTSFSCFCRNKGRSIPVLHFVRRYYVWLSNQYKNSTKGKWFNGHPSDGVDLCGPAISSPSHFSRRIPYSSGESNDLHPDAFQYPAEISLLQKEKKGSYPDCTRSALISPKPLNKFIGLNEVRRVCHGRVSVEPRSLIIAVGFIPV
jgi:hypothetical protein